MNRFGAEAGQPIPGDLRVAWRLALVTLVVNKCRGARASWNQVHVLSWALLTRMETPELTRRLSGHRAFSDRPIGVDPGVNAAIDLAFGYGLLTRVGATLSLTDAGRRLLNAIQASDAFEVERTLLDNIPGKVTRGAADSAMSPKVFS